MKDAYETAPQGGGSRPTIDAKREIVYTVYLQDDGRAPRRRRDREHRRTRSAFLDRVVTDDTKNDDYVGQRSGCGPRRLRRGRFARCSTRARVTRRYRAQKDGSDPEKDE